MDSRGARERIENVNIAKIFEKRVTTASSNTALVYYGRKFSYKDLGRYARLFAHAFMMAGIKKGDRVALMMSNVPQFVFAYYGALLAGAVVVPVNLLSLPRSYRVDDEVVRVPDEIREQIRDSEPSLILAFNFYFPLLKALEGEIEARNIKVLLTQPQEFMPMGLKQLAPLKLRRQGRAIRISNKPRWLDDWKKLFSKAKNGRLRKFDTFAGKVLEESDIAQIQYTGGTTGIPKGAVLTHGNLLSNMRQVSEAMGDFLERDKEVVLGVLPFFHTYGLTACMQMTLLEQGGALVLVADSSEIKQWMKWIKEHKVTTIPSIPRIYEAVVSTHQNLLREDIFSSVKLFLNGAGVLPPQIRQTFEEISGGRIVEGYGLSEASPVVSVGTPDNFREGSIGKPLPDTEVRIVDVASPREISRRETTGKNLPVGKEGEIVVRGPQVMQGYWNKPKETARVLRDGWLYTGDVGRFDADGFLYITDRMKDMVKIGGENVYPSRIEAALLRFPKIQDAVIVGVPDEKHGERLVACVVLEKRGAGSPDLKRMLRGFLRGSLAPFEIPNDFRIVESLDPFKNQLGKVLKRKVREAVQKDEL